MSEEDYEDDGGDEDEEFDGEYPGDAAVSASSSESESDTDESEEDTTRFKAMSLDDSELHVEELFHKGSSQFVSGTDFAASLVVMQKAAARGHADAMWVLDVAQRWVAAGNALPCTKECVRQLFETELDTPQGLCFSAWLWHDEDPGVAFARYSEAAERFNYSRAVARCGFCHDKGAGVPQDLAMACKFYKRAADLNHPVGAYNYACCLENGEGVEANLDLAIVYYKKASAVHYSPAAYNLACLYGNSKLPDIFDEQKAEHFFRLAARLGDMWSAFALAGLLERRKTPDAFAEAAYWLSRSAEFKDRMARRAIGDIRAVRAYRGQRNERALFWYGRVLSMEAFVVPDRVWNHLVDRRNLGSCVATSRVYQFIMFSVRRAAVYWILAATRELGLVKDVAVHIAKMVFASRSKGGWWVRDSPFEALPDLLLEKIFCQINRLGDWGALARTCTRFGMLTSMKSSGEDLFEKVLQRFGCHAGLRGLLRNSSAFVRKVKLYRSAEAQPEEVFVTLAMGVLIVARSDFTGMPMFDAGMANERFRLLRVERSKEDGTCLEFVLAGETRRVFVADFGAEDVCGYAEHDYNMYPMVRGEDLVWDKREKNA